MLQFHRRFEPRFSLGDDAPALSLEETIAQLTIVRQGHSPRGALEAAIAWREEITPRLFDELCLAPVDVQARCNAQADRKVAYWLHTFAFFLLGLFEDKRAYPLMLDYFASDSDLAEDLSGEVLSGYLPSLLVRCFDGSDLRGLRLLIETATYEPTFRYECLQAYHGLALAGRIGKAEVVTFVEHLLDAVPENATFDRWYVWLAMAAAELQEPRLRARIDELFDRGLMSNASDSAFEVATKEDIADIYESRPGKIAASILKMSFYDHFVDRVCRWAWFQAPRDGAVDPVDRAFEAFEHDVPFVRIYPKIGRNDPCPCGSGKKYKKCCMN